MQTGKPRFLGIQILRGLASLLVLFHHEFELAPGTLAGTSLPLFFGNGAFGVDLFFPISGFVMFLSAWSLARREPAPIPAWQEFVWRRILRVVPLYWLCTTLKLLLFFVFPASMLHFHFHLKNVLASYLFLPTLGPEGTPLPVLAVGWTLNYEMYFYLLVAVAVGFRLPLLRFLSITVGLISLLGFLLPERGNSFAFLADPIQLEFLAGLFLAAFLSRVQAAPAWMPALLLPASLFFALFRVFAPVAVWGHSRALVWGLPGALIVGSVLALEPHLSLHRQRFLLLLGDSSYALYLSHTFFLPAVGLLLFRLGLHGATGLLALVVLSTAVCVPAGILVHLYLEVPLLHLLSRRPIPWSSRSAEAA